MPGHIQRMHEKALSSRADVVMLDLEDSVPPDKKNEALSTIIQSLQNLDKGSRTITVRINSADTPLAYREIIELAENAGDKIDALVVPKINHPGDVYFVSRLLGGIEKARLLEHRILIEASIETAKGLEAVSEIAKASSRVKSLVFGVADYSESVGAGLSSLSGHGENEEDIYPGHRWHYPLSKIVAAAKANDLLAIDAPYGDFKNPDGLERSAAVSRALGCDGKWVIHPGQIDVVNQVFTPSKQDIQLARRILDAIKTADRAGKGAIGVEGKMIDQATVRLAKKMWNQAKSIGLV